MCNMKWTNLNYW